MHPMRPAGYGMDAIECGYFVRHSHSLTALVQTGSLAGRSGGAVDPSFSEPKLAFRAGIRERTVDIGALYFILSPGSSSCPLKL